MKTIKVRVIGSYGTPLVYPVCDIALAFAAIAGTKTLTPKVIRLVRELGYEVDVEAPALPNDRGEL